MYSKEIIDTREFFGEITEQLLFLLHSLKPEEWNAKTCYPNWTVKDIVTHLYQTGTNRLSNQRDLYPSGKKPTPIAFTTLSNLINQSNSDWTALLQGISPQLLVEFLEISEKQLTDFIISQELEGDAYYPVSWAGETSSQNWFDIAREFTERWHHQQQIREAVNAKSIAIPRYLIPVIRILMHAIPYWYKDIDAELRTKLRIEITGDSGGIWILEKREENWSFCNDINVSYNEIITLSDDTIWRFFMRSISKDKGSNLINLSSMEPICKRFLDVKAVMMND